MISNKWFGFFSFVWIISMLLGSVFERMPAEVEGEIYSAGTITVTENSTAIVGSDTSWTSLMEGGLIKRTSESSWYRIKIVTDTTNLILFVKYANSDSSGAYEMVTSVAWFGVSGESKLEYLMDLKHITYQEGEVGALAWLTPNPVYFETLRQIITWDFTFLRGDGYEIVRWVVLTPFSIAIVAGLFLSFIQLMMGFIRL